jgi:hypothetical protein
VWSCGTPEWTGNPDIALIPECNFRQPRAILLAAVWRNRNRIDSRNGKAGEINMTKLTDASRKNLPKRDLVFADTRRYPIEDVTHARDALARSSGKPEHTAVVTAVRRKYPEMDIEK